MGLFGRKRMKTRDAQGRKVVVVTDKRGTVRKTKIKDKKNQITTKERYDRSGNLTKRKAKGKYIKRFKAKTSNPTFDQSVFQSNQQVKNLVSGNPILNAKRNEILTMRIKRRFKIMKLRMIILRLILRLILKLILILTLILRIKRIRIMIVIFLLVKLIELKETRIQQLV